MRRKYSADTAPGYRFAMIMLGIAATPVLLSSSSLGSQLSSTALIKAVCIAAVILTVLAAITISVGEKARLPTYGIVKYPFGSKGAIAINLLMAISLFGWIAVTANMFGNTLHGLLASYGMNVPVPVLVGTGCVIFVASTAFGFAVLGKIAQFAVPVIAAVLLYILLLANEGSTASEVMAVTLSSMSTGVAVSTIVGTIIVLVATLPDFGSFVHDRKHGLIAAILCFLLAYPLLYWAGAMPSQLTGQGSLTGAMALFGGVLPATLLLIFACVTGNGGNMFQGTLVVSTLLPIASKWRITVALGVLAAIVGSLDIMAWFIPFLLFLGIATPPVAGIYIADFFLYRRQGYLPADIAHDAAVKPLAFAIWLAASAVGLLTLRGLFTLTTIPSLDSILVACVAYAVISSLSKRPAAAATSGKSA